MENPRSLQIALWGGIAFSLAFTALIWLAGERLNAVPLLPDQGALWYYWKLPNPTFMTHLTAWSFYALHQIALWSLIYYAQTRVQKYATGLHPVNLWALGVNAGFILLHFVQSHLWYDGLAQDTPVWSSQGSVILMLCVILIMENKRRGMFFGAKAPLSKRVMDFARKYHGYLFAWAVVYTFWFHPMVNPFGHLVGFFYMFLLMLQGSLFLTRIHVNKAWTVFQEVTVLFHGTLVAVSQGNGIWPMFAFGFGGMFVISQMHGLGWSRLTRWLVGLGYIAAVLTIYSSRGWGQLNEIIRIPLIEYLVAFAIAGLIAIGIWIADRRNTVASNPSSVGRKQ
ncbi:MAG: hypothetical protein CO094_06585 [Anaerolineae bacterium CG_4_9_14_3_um_filter_57_17]|nr:hypothetical protein [bacterium]NCT21550.1 hypothetical protein [bacterium]OIO86806.1 MAG: serine active site containing 1-like protein [Anaerolineae bacterium CG2_30_57_67]PJB66714.1 MAG: hypothetical protein CO094_06585 [Anaerolineae bacterium CG_4_9_14_3_um_filter_57_17]